MTREIEYASSTVFEDVMTARNEGQDFRLIVRGELAKKLHDIVPFYERYQRSNFSGAGRQRAIASFGLRAIRAPLFWGVCILASFKSRNTNFVFADELLYAEFTFSPD